MQGGEARFAGDVVMEVNPTPPDLTNVSITPQGVVLTLRVAVPSGDGDGGGEGEARVVGRVVATVTYGPGEGRTASGSVDIPTEELDAIKRSAVALLKRFGGAAQAQAFQNGAVALGVARQQGEYRGNDS